MRMAITKMSGTYESSGGPFSSEISLKISLEIPCEISHVVGLCMEAHIGQLHVEFEVNFHSKMALQSFTK